MNEVLHILQGKVGLEELQIGDELLILSHLEAFHVLLLEELKDHRLFMVQLLLCHLLFNDLMDTNSGKWAHLWVETLH